jgi:DNA-binding transcriptional MerR regulator
MTTRHLHTSDLARAIRVHENTIRHYEEWGYLSTAPRGPNGYRQYTSRHLEQARLVHLALWWPYLASDRSMLIELVKSAASNDLGMAMELAYRYLAHVRMERTAAEAALEFLDRWAAGYVWESSRHILPIKEAAQHLNVTVDMLRNWERNGLIAVPRDPSNGYRRYGSAEFGRLRVIRTLVKSGYSQIAILRMLNQFDAGHTDHLRDALHLQPEADETLERIADRWLASLRTLEERAQAIIRQISHLMKLAHTP